MGRWFKAEMELLGAIALLALLPATASAATTISVTDNTTDAPLNGTGPTCESTDLGNGCTLRAAVELASLDSVHNGDEAITIDVPAKTFNDTLGALEIEEDADVVIIGAGAGQTIIDGEEEGSVFEVNEKASLTVQGVTIENGLAEYGGGIWGGYKASITIDRSTIANNRALEDEFGGYGGGVYGYEASITIDQSTIAENEATNEGGGIYGYNASIKIEQSTIANNQTEEGDGGGVAEETVTEETVEAATPACADTTSTGHAKTNAKPASVAPPEEGSLTVKQSTITENIAGAEDDGDGGGIYVVARPEGECPSADSSTQNAQPATTLASNEAGLTVEQSTIAKNTAEEGDGGGIYVEMRFLIDPIVNSTIADNEAGYEGGGIYAGDADFSNVIFDTVFDNTTEEEAGNNLSTGDESGRINLLNTIVAEPNETAAEEANCEGNIGSLLPGEGHNLVYPSESGGSPHNCGLSTSDHDLVGVPPGFDPGLQSNGGPTQTIALAGSSPAVGYVPLTDCVESSRDPLTVDQRGYPRPGIPGDGCDIGAYEYQYVAPTPNAPTPAAAVLGVKITVPKQCTSKRDITIHIQNVKQLGIVSAVVSVDGHAKRTLRGKHLRTAINLRGLPKGTFTVEIVGRRRNGHTVRAKRTYHTCIPRLPNGSNLLL